MKHIHTHTTLTRGEFIKFCLQNEKKEFLRKNKWILKAFDRHKYERWKDIPASKGRFQASSLGRIRRIAHWTTNGSGHRKWVPEQLTTIRMRPNGYLTTCVGGGKFLVHRLVCAAFHANPENKPEVNHIDCNPNNNNAKNLQWATRVENMRHAHANGLIDYYTPAKIAHLKKINDARKALSKHSVNK